MYQTLKYIFIRIGIALFLLLTFGFLALYFIHEVALPGASFDDSFFQQIIFFISLFFGIFAYGVVGEQKFHNAMYKLKNIPSISSSDEVIDGFESVLDFTYSSYFLPRRGKHLRNDVTLKFANYLLLVGSKDSRAQKIYLKAFLLRPDDSSYRTPLLSVFKKDDDLTDEEQMAVAIDWYIAMWDEAIARGVAEESMGMIALSATTNKLIKVFGDEGAAALLQRTVDNVKNGQFDVEDEESEISN